MTAKILKDIALVTSSHEYLLRMLPAQFLPGGLTMMAYSFLVIVFGVFAFLVWHEKSHDEREERHRAFASQIAFLAGGAVLVAGIVYQGLMEYEINVWVAWALIAMLMGRLAGRLWAQRNF